MKWLGALLVMTASLSVSLKRIGALRKEIRLLERLIGLLRFVQRELIQRGTPLPELVRNAQAQDLLPDKLAYPLVEKLKAGETVAQAVTPYLQSLPDTCAGILESLCAVLGRYDSRTQACACEQALSELDLLRRQLDKKVEEKGKVYGMLPVTLGLMAVLLLF